MTGPFDTETLAERLMEDEPAPLTPAPLPNRQLYENSPLCGSSVEQDYWNDPDRLYNDKAPNLAIQSESPRHRMAVFLKAQGLSNNEIAERLKFTVPWVSQILRQPWARALLIREITSQGRDAVSEIIKAAATDSVFTLIELRSDPAVPATVRRAAADSLLDRFLGKPTQRVEQTNVNVTPQELADVERQLAAVKAEEARLLGVTVDNPKQQELTNG